VVVSSIRRLRSRQGAVTVHEAIAAYLDTLDSPGTRRNYAATLAALTHHLGDETAVDTLDTPAAAQYLASWFTDRWGRQAPATFNRNLDALRSATGGVPGAV
jgi:hypothetical protein